MKSILVNFLMIVLMIGTLSGQSHKTVNDLFTPSPEPANGFRANPAIRLLQINQTALKDLYANQSRALSLSLPYDGREVILDLVETDIFSASFKVVDSKEQIITIQPGRHFQGNIRGKAGSFAAVSIFGDEVAGLLSDAAGNYNLGRIKNSDAYAFYLDRESGFDIHHTCKVKDTRPEQDIRPEDLLEVRSSKTVNLYVELDYDIIQGAGSVSNAVNYATGLYNQVVALYARDGITMKISKIKAWDTPSPYTYDPDGNDKTGDYLASFQKNSGSFDGHVAQLITVQDLGGGVATGFHALCANEPDSSKCIAAIDGTYENIPTFSWDVQVCTHEVGHLLGSRHTHACVWNGNNTAIDGCATYIEGECPLPGYPAEGGTIMSYCHQQAVGINLSLGFGTQPKNYILNRINNAACLAGESTLTVDPQFIVIPPTGGCASVNVTTGAAWQGEFDPQYPPYFLTSAAPLSGTGNASVQFCAGNNTLPVPFYTVFWVYDDNTEIPVIIRQDSVYEPKAVFYPGNEKIVPFTETTFTLDILTNTDWKLVLSDYDKKWVDIRSATSGVRNAPFTVRVLKNTTPLNRYSRIAMVYNNGLDTTYFTISQPCENSGYLNVPAEFTAAGFTSQYKFSVYSDLDWEVTDYPAWVTMVNPLKGKKDQSVTVTIDENTTGNERFGTMTFVVKIGKDSIVKKVNINQLSLRSDESRIDYKVYPNPATDGINVQLNASVQSDLNIALTSTNGNTVKVLEKGRQLIGNFSSGYDISDLAPGCYTLTIKYGEQTRREKIVILR